jgi:hypothetical protein
VLRDELIAEINGAKNGDELALWAHRRFAAKNTLTADDAKAVETAYLEILKVTPVHQAAEPVKELPEPAPVSQRKEEAETELEGSAQIEYREQPVTALPKSTRARNKAHLRFVAAQPCPSAAACDAHHIKFANPELGRGRR